MKNPVNIEVYGVLVEFDMLKVLEAGVLVICLSSRLQRLPITLIWSVPELDTFNIVLTHHLLNSR